MARIIHEELRFAIRRAWEHGKMWRSPLTRSMYGQYGRRYEVTVESTGVFVYVWNNEVARLCYGTVDGRHQAWLYDGGVPSAMTRDALQAVADALGIRARFSKRGGEITCAMDGLVFSVPTSGMRFLWG